MDVQDNDETWDADLNDNLNRGSASESSSDELDGGHTILSGTIRALEQDDDETMDVELPDVDFPRYEYGVFKDGLNKYPAWTVFPNHLAKCLGAAAAIVKAQEEMTSPDVQRLKTLYQQLAVDAFEKCLQERALREWPMTVQEHIYGAVEHLLDLLVVKLPQLELEGGGAEDDLHPLLMCLSMAFDRQCEYHQKHKFDGAEDYLKKRKSNASLGINEAGLSARPIVASPEKTNNYDWFCQARADYVTEVNECECRACYPGVSHVLLSNLLNRFSATKYGDGYAEILKLLKKASQLPLLTIERLLEPLAFAVDLFTQSLLQKFAEPCRNLLDYIAALLDHDLDTFSDKTKQGSYASVSQILRHLRGIFGKVMLPEVVEQLVSPVQRKLVERMLGYQSFNKQLSAVREISKLLSSARSSSLRDGAEAVHSTIEWLEKKDVLRVILRSHLHHKQYVDQVKIIMKFLLQERRLSEEHLDAIWAATEKPDQFEAVKNNIFELLADLAWSFSDMQLDSLFNRFERSKGRPSEDVLKVLQLIKRLARSDTRGVMATKLLELLWNMLLSGEAQGEILESNSFVEILQYYDSVKRADKQVYIKRCLSSIEKGEAVLPCLSLLTKIFMQDDVNVALQGQAQHSPRVQHINELEKQHGMVSLVAKSLEHYMVHARTLSPELLVGAPGSKPPLVDGQSTHVEHIQSRLDFMFFVLNWSQHDLSWDVAELIWECLVVKGASKSDADRALTWFHRLLVKGSAVLISNDAQSKLLLQKMAQSNPADLSMVGYQCFQQLFQRVNVNEKKLVIEGDCLLTADLDLSGLQILWNIALLSREEGIANLAVDSLRTLFLNLSEGLQPRTLEIRNTFTSEVFRRLEGTLAAGGSNFTRPDGGEPDAGRQLSSASATEEAPSKPLEKMDEDEAIAGTNVSAAAAGADVSSASADVSMTPAEVPGEVAVAAGREALQAERCLRLLRVFIDSCESRCMKRQPVHGAFYKGLPLELEIVTTVKNQRTVVLSHTNEYIGMIRAKVAAKMNQTSARIRLMSRGRELVHDAHLARQENLVTGAHVQVALRVQDDRALPFEEEELPGVVLSKKEEVYEVLFKLCGSNELKVRERAQQVLQLLPTHPGILADFYWILEAKSADEVHDLLDQLFGVKERLLYTLQVLDGVLQPTNRKPDARGYFLRQKLTEYKCESYLTDVFGPDALPSNLDDAARKALYTSALRILRYLLITNKPTTTALDELDPEARAGAVARAEERARARAGKPREKEVKPAGINDLPDLVMKMMRLTWAMAVGKPAYMASEEAFDSFPVPEPQPPETEEAQWAPPDEEEFLCKDALDLLQKAIATTNDAEAAFFHSPNFPRFVIDVLLRAPNPYVRQDAHAFLGGVLQAPSFAAKLMQALVSARARADALPRQSKEFWDMFCRLLTKFGAADTEIGVQLLREELAWLRNAPTVVEEEEDEGMEGHLNVLKTLVKVFPKFRWLGAPQTKHPNGQGLCEKLIKQFLFPEAVLLQGDDLEAPRSASGGKPLEELVLQEAKCSTQKSRQAAFALLEELAHDYVPNFLVIKDLLLRLHFRQDLHEWEASPSYSRKMVGNFVGLKNAGATCYMNSVFQQLYMQPQVRKTILAADECEDVERKESVFYQLQAMFGALLASSLDHYTPQGFWAAYRDIDGQPINLREHQDAFEFFNVLFDQVDEKLKAKGHMPTLTEIFGGTFAQQVICRGCPHRSERDEPFNAIGVEVKGKRDLQEALESFVKGDLLEADNAYDCAICNKKVDALKRVCVKTLPHALIVHLKRFDFDYETMQRLKVKDRFVFPMHLDMHPYTVEGLAASENNASTSEDNDGTSTVVMRPDAYYHYDLVGVVVHSGTAFAGHYYSYIKERDGDKPFGSKDPNSNGWMVFDDKRVEPYNIDDLEKDCFGGKFVPEAFDNGMKPMQEFDRPNSAYMLLYERSTPVSVSEHSSPETSPSTPTTGEAIPNGEKKGELDPQLEEAVKISPGSGRRGTVQMPPSIHRIVWQENLQSVSESHLLDSDYFGFLLQLANSCLQAYEKRLRSTEQLVHEANDIAKASAELFVEFLMRVYLRAHKDIRGDIRAWKVVVMNFLQSSPHFTHHFLMRLLETPEWLREGLLSCNSDDIRTAIGDWIITAMLVAAEYNKGRKEDVMRLGHFVDLLNQLVKECQRLKAYVKELIDILTAYGKIGMRQKAELLQDKYLFLPQLAFNALQEKVTAFNTEEWEALVRCFAELLPAYDLTLICKPNTPVKAGTEKSVGALNPYKAPDSPMIPVTEHIVEWVIFREDLWQLMFDKCHSMQELVLLMQFCSWENLKFTTQLLVRLLNFIADSPSRDCHMMPAILASLLQIKDSFQKTRHILLFDGDTNVDSLTDLILDGETLEPKRRWLIQLVLNLHRGSPMVGRTIRQSRLNGEDGWVHIVHYMETRWLAIVNENQRAHAESTLEGVKLMLTPPTKKEVAARAVS